MYVEGKGVQQLDFLPVSKRDNFCDFLIASLDSEMLLLRADSHWEGMQKRKW